MKTRYSDMKNQYSDMKNDLTHRDGVSYSVPFVLITTLFFLWGFARAILDILNKHLQNEMDISISQSSLIQVTTYLGYFLMAIPAGLFINRHGYRKGVVFGLLLFGAGALLFIPGSWMDSFPMFLLCLFVIGCGLTFLETAANPYATELGSPETATSRLNLSQSFNGMGSLFATYAIGQFFFRSGGEGVAGGGDVAVPYAVLGALVLLIALVFSRVQLPELTAATGDETSCGDRGREEAGSRGGWANIRALLRHRMFMFGLLALLSYEVAEISINSYFMNFVTGQGWLDDNMASVVLTFALGFFMVDRFLGSWLMRHIPATRMLVICASGTVVCIALVLADLGKVSLVALICNFLFEAIMFPTIFSLTLTGLGRLTKSASSLLMMTPVGGCGFLLMGYIADMGHWTWPFVIPFAGFVVVWLYALARHKRVSPAELS